ncbi:hypothetical protein Efla_006966 [Eimeria flavescens]
MHRGFSRSTSIGISGQHDAAFPASHDGGGAPPPGGAVGTASAPPTIAKQAIADKTASPRTTRGWRSLVTLVALSFLFIGSAVAPLFLYPKIVFDARSGILSTPSQISWRVMVTPTISCKADPPFVMLVSMVNAADFERRHIIRSTWGGAGWVFGRRVRLIFVLGTHPLKSVQVAVKAEAREFGDILQHAAPDKYNLLTQKAITAIQWAATSCREARFLVKADTDIYLDMDRIVTYLIAHEHQDDLAAGFVYRSSPALRSPSHRNYQDPVVFPEPVYPPYMAGPCYILSGNLVAKIADISKTVPRLSNEDCFVGLCLQKLDVSPQDAAPMAPMLLTFEEPSDIEEVMKWAMVHPVRTEAILSFWTAARKLKSTP